MATCDRHSQLEAEPVRTGPSEKVPDQAIATPLPLKLVSVWKSATGADEELPVGLFSAFFRQHQEILQSVRKCLLAGIECRGVARREQRVVAGRFDHLVLEVAAQLFRACPALRGNGDAERFAVIEAGLGFVGEGLK
jgi:hypothetical protein